MFRGSDKHLRFWFCVQQNRAFLFFLSGKWKQQIDSHDTSSNVGYWFLMHQLVTFIRFANIVGYICGFTKQSGQKRNI